MAAAIGAALGAAAGPLASVFSVFKPLLIVGSFGFLVAAMSNLVGNITGQNPMAQVSTTIMQTMVPMMVTLMPPIIFMNLFMGMINNMMQTFTAPFREVATFRYPTTGVV
jgi:flagellar biosynthesis protein FlhB